jgi:hypothetical protein
LPTTLVSVTITLSTLALFIVAIIIRRMLSLFVVAHRCGRGRIVDTLLPATARLC